MTQEELNTRGKTEIVSIVLPLKAQNAEDFASEIQKMLGPYGQVQALSQSNQLWLQDQVATLRQILITVQGMEDPEKKGNVARTYMHVCKYVKARDTAQILKDLLSARRTQQLNPFMMQMPGGAPGALPPGFNPAAAAAPRRYGRQARRPGRQRWQLE